MVQRYRSASEQAARARRGRLWTARVLALAGLLAWGGGGRAQDAPGEPPGSALGWLWNVDDASRGPSPYEPREGDIILFSSISPSQVFFYALARTGHPFHSGLVVKRIDGVLAVLESGSAKEATTLKPIDERLAEYKCSYRGSVFWVRRNTRPLSPCQSDRLTWFAEKQVGKPFVSNLRFVQMAVPGKPSPPDYPDQEKWFCSEIVWAALESAGMVYSPLPAGSLVPTDFYYDRRIDISARWLPPQEWTPEPQLPRRRPWLAPRPRR